MKKPHRHIHRAVWVLLVPLLIYGIFTALDGRITPVTDQPLSGVDKREVFQ